MTIKNMNMRAEVRSTQPFHGIGIYAVEVRCIGERQWEAKLRIQGEQLPISCGSHHTSKSAAIDAALDRARQENERAQSVFEQWLSATKAELST